MPESQVSALLKPADAELYASVEAFLSGITDGMKAEKRSKTIVEIGGDSYDVEDQIDDFVDSLDSAAFVRLRYYDEYGTEIFWVIDDGELSKFRHDFEEESKRVVKAYEAFHEGLGRVRVGWLTKAEVAEMKKVTNDPRTRQYLDVIFWPPVAKPLDRMEFDDGYNMVHGVHSDADSSFGNWYPIARDKGKPPEGLIEQILEKTGRSFYAKTYRDGSFTQRVLHCTPDGITELFNTSDYTKAELKYVQAHTDKDRFGEEFEWTHLDLGAVRVLLETDTLRDYVEERVAAYREEIAEDQRKLKELLAAHPDDREPLLEGLSLYLWYVEADAEDMKALARLLQVKGMKKEEVEKMYHLGKKEMVRVSKPLEAAGNWLVANVEALANHEVVVEDDDLPSVVIHMT